MPHEIKGEKRSAELIGDASKAYASSDAPRLKDATRFDIQNHIKTRKAQEGYLGAVLEDGDPSLIAAAIGDIARARRHAVRQGKRPQPRDDLQNVSAGRKSATRNTRQSA